MLIDLSKELGQNMGDALVGYRRGSCIGKADELEKSLRWPKVDRKIRISTEIQASKHVQLWEWKYNEEL